MTRKQKDLFGEPVPPKRSRLEILLVKHDRTTLSARIERFRFLRKVISPRVGLVGPSESVFMFNEAQLTFINAEYIATLLLAQAFIEHQLETQMEARGYPGGSRGLKYILQYCRQHELLPTLVIDKIEYLRQVRNPFAHTKPYEYPHSLSQRLLHQNAGAFKGPGALLLQDAKEAIRTMVTMLSLELR